MYSTTTSGTTNQGIGKMFTLTDQQLRARVARDDRIKGESFKSIRSLFVGLSSRSTSGMKYREWAYQHDAQLYWPLESPDRNIVLFKNGQIEGIIDNPQWLSAYAGMNWTGHRFKFACGSGAAVTSEMSQRIRERLCPTPIFTYGAAEIGTIAIASADEVEAIPGCVGRILDDIELEIDRGEVCVRRDDMITSYSDPVLTAKNFRDGWFYPGDRAEMRDGLLVLLGRVPA